MRILNRRRRWSVVTGLAVVTIVGWGLSDLTQVRAQAGRASSGTPAEIADGVSVGRSSAAAAPARYALTELAAPPALSAEQVDRLEAQMSQINLPPGRGRQTPGVPMPLPDTQTEPGSVSAAGDPPSDAPGTLAVTFSAALAPTTGKSTINEPSTANLGGYVFYTGNWYAARSRQGGVPGSWTYFSPYADMADFCCDQDVIASPSRQIFLWYRQGVYSAATGQNRFALTVSYEGTTACTYFVRPMNVNGTWANQWFDYPHLMLTNDFLYITTSMFSGGGGFLRQVILKWPLDPLQTCAGFGYSYWAGNLSGWGEPAQGATTTAYWGDHRGLTNTFRVFYQPESSNTLYWVDRAIPVWTFENRDASCPGPDGRNWCARSDSRIQAGWVRQPEESGVGEVGFMWNAKQGGGFPVPYVEAATFDQNTLNLTGRPYIWNSSFTWHYPFASPNARGDLGITVSGGSTTTPVGTLFAIDDDFNGAPPGWENIYLRVGTHGATAWGDYVRNRPHEPDGLYWISAGHTQQGSASGTNTEPRYYVLGRQRDLYSMLKFLYTTWQHLYPIP